MNWKIVSAIIALFIIFGLPIASGIQLPKDCTASEIGNFLGNVLAYWREVLVRILQNLKIPVKFELGSEPFEI